MKKNKLLKFLIAILFSGTFLYFAFRKIDLKEVLRILENVNIIWVLASMSVIVISNVFRALRWKYLLSENKDIALSKFYSSIMIGMMANNLLPARAGEFIRAYSISKNSGVNKSKAFATIVLERILDGLTVLLFFVIVLFFYFPNVNNILIDQVKYWGLLFYFFALFVLIMLKINKKLTLSIIKKIFSMFSEKLSERIIGITESFIKGLDVLHDFKGTAISVFYSLVTWLIATISFYFLMIAFHIQLPFYTCFVVLCLVVIGVMVPGAGGGAGTMHYMCILSLTFLGVDKETAGAYAIMIHITNFLVYVCIGTLYFYLENISFKDMEGKIEKNS